MQQWSENMDARELHGLSCKPSAERHARHAGLNNIINGGLQNMKIPSILKAVELTEKIARDIMILFAYSFSNGRSLSWNATCSRHQGRY